MRRLPRQALTLSAILFTVIAVQGLSGCAAFRKRPPEPIKPEVKVTCPKAKVLSDARALVKFQPGPGRDLTDIEYQAQVSGLEQRCKTKKKGDAARVALSLRFSASLGPAARSDRLTVPYFVAVTQGERILSKESFTTDLRFEKNARHADAAEEIKRLDLPATAEPEPLEILVGIQLTPEEVAYNRAHGG